ncbi:MAG: patatin-like phospholipase family protein [Actinomycetia bacterium]|nr:patatin-like phospholipase family protein [Actinomycetes bacterium]
MSRADLPRTAFVLGGGGVLGATQVGMLHALFEHGIRPDLILGTSIGSVNGAFVAADPTQASAERLTALWKQVREEGDFLESPLKQAARAAKYRTHFMSVRPLKRLVEENLAVERIEDLAVPFQCVAAHIESSKARWFTSGPITQAILASCAVPGMFPPVEIDGQHFLDGGLVHSIPVGRALALGATEIYVLQVGRVEQPLNVPTKPWEVASVAFEIARRHRYHEELDSVPDHVRLHVLPSGSSSAPAISIAQGVGARIEQRSDQAYAASVAYLDKVASGG